MGCFLMQESTLDYRYDWYWLNPNPSHNVAGMVERCSDYILIIVFFEQKKPLCFNMQPSLGMYMYNSILMRQKDRDSNIFIGFDTAFR